MRERHQPHCPGGYISCTCVDAEPRAASPGPAAVTPGQRAREAFMQTPIIPCSCTQVPELPPCEHLMPGWEAAAQAAIGESDSIALDRFAMAQEAISDLAAERDRLRDLAAEILAALGPRPNGISNPQIAKWRQRAGLDAACSVCEETGSPHGVPQPPPPGRSFEDLLADPCEQFDPRSELLASIAEYAAAPQASASACPSPQPAPELAAAMAETRKVRDAACKLIDLFGAPDGRRMRHASVTAATIERYAAEAGVRP